MHRRTQRARRVRAAVAVLVGLTAVPLALGTAVDTASAAPLTLTRIDGASRYETALAASRRFPAGSASTVVLVGGSSPVDALSAATVAGRFGSPILLTPRDALPAEVAAELRRLGAKTVVVAGGDAVVGPAVVAALRPTVTVRRVAGQDRYETSALLATLLSDTHPTTVFVASGTSAVDAVAVSPLAAALGAPVLLVRPDGVPAATRFALTSLDAADVVVLGGLDSVSRTTAEAVGGTERVGGGDRYETATLLAEHAIRTAGFSGARFGLALGTSADDVADALVAGPLLARNRTPLLLSQTPEELGVTTENYLASRAGRFSGEALVFGGTAALTAGVVRSALWASAPVPVDVAVPEPGPTTVPPSTPEPTPTPEPSTPDPTTPVPVPTTSTPAPAPETTPPPTSSTPVPVQPDAPLAVTGLRATGGETQLLVSWTRSAPATGRAAVTAYRVNVTGDADLSRTRDVPATATAEPSTAFAGLPAGQVTVTVTPLTATAGRTGHAQSTTATVADSRLGYTPLLVQQATPGTFTRGDRFVVTFPDPVQAAGPSTPPVFLLFGASGNPLDSAEYLKTNSSDSVVIDGRTVVVTLRQDLTIDTTDGFSARPHQLRWNDAQRALVNAATLPLAVMTSPGRDGALHVSAAPTVVGTRTATRTVGVSGQHDAGVAMVITPGGEQVAKVNVNSGRYSYASGRADEGTWYVYARSPGRLPGPAAPVNP